MFDFQFDLSSKISDDLSLERSWHLGLCGGMFGKVFTAEGDRVLAGLIQLVYNLWSRHRSDGHGISEGCLLKLFFFKSCFIFCFYFEAKSANLSSSFYEMSRRFCTCSFYIIRKLMQKRLQSKCPEASHSSCQVAWFATWRTREVLFIARLKCIKPNS